MKKREKCVSKVWKMSTACNATVMPEQLKRRQKRPTIEAKEPYYRVKRALL